MRGTLTLGSMVGYSGKKVFTIKDIAKAIDEVNVCRTAKSQETIPCMVSESLLIGRTGDAKYEETVFNLEFSISPRRPSMGKAKFYQVLLEYADSLGARLEQTRVYVEFKDETTVLKMKLRK